MIFKSFETERLIFELLDHADCETLYYYRCLPEVARFQGWQPESDVECAAFIQRFSSDREIRLSEWKQAGIYLKENRELIGDCGFCVRKEKVVTAEIGYTIMPVMQNRGYGTETVQGLVHYLFTALDIDRILADTDPHNKGSIRILQKNHFEASDHGCSRVKIRGQWVNSRRFILNREAWKSVIRKESAARLHATSGKK